MCASRACCAAIGYAPACMTTVILPAPGHEALGRALAERLGAQAGTVEYRRFPDGESYVRIATPVDGATVVIAACLKDPDPQLPSVLFLADAARDMGARRVGLATPYLAYMRQDHRFRDGEAVTSRTFAALVSGAFDWLCTVDPHLHRYASLDEIYRIPSVVSRAAPAIAAWVRDNVPDAVIVGPDSESAQWAAEVARSAGVPSTVLEKVRRGDRDVSVAGETGVIAARTPVLLDDIISSANTMAEAARLLRAAGTAAPVCIGIHALFATGAEELLREAGVARVVTCNTVRHPTNAIDVTPGFAASIRSLL
jgi:ribose-phosphate pyrophosphokinase